MAKAPRPVSPRRGCCCFRAGGGAQRAAFLRDITENIALAARQASIAGYVAHAPAGQEALFDGHLADGTALLLADGTSRNQRMQGFGRCPLHAVTAMLHRGHQAAAVLNSDSPTLPRRCWSIPLLRWRRTAIGWCWGRRGRRRVLSAGNEGGACPIIAEIAWSTDRVAETTRLRAAELGLDVVELPTWYDVDDITGLSRLLQETDLANTAPFTSMALQRMGLRGQALDLAAE